MKSRKLGFLVPGILAGILVVACGAAFTSPGDTDELVKIGQAKWPEASQSSLQEGHDLFVASCGKGGFCHKLVTPKSREAGTAPHQWGEIIVRMGKKANLNDAQRESVLRFILAVRDLPDSPIDAK